MQEEKEELIELETIAVAINDKLKKTILSIEKMMGTMESVDNRIKLLKKRMKRR